MSAEPKLFISYRRGESAAYAGRIYDALVARFGEQNVFMDLDLAPGVDFVQRITEAVAGCQVLLEIMGPTWATVKNQEGRTRIADPEDYVRLELETALRRPDVTVIPVLIGGGTMPDRADLPPELRGITRRNALELSDQRWSYDVGRLMSALDELLATPTAPDTARTTEDVDVPTGASASATSTAPPRSRPGIAAPGGAAGWFRERGRLVAGGIALALVAVLVVVAISALGGGSGGGGKPDIKFDRYTGSDEFTVDVPAGWPRTLFEEPMGGVIKTKFENPDNDGTVEIDQEDETPPEDRQAVAEQMRSTEPGYKLITSEPKTVAGRDAELFVYEHDEDFGPATVATYFFNAGGFGWRTRAAVAKAAGDSAATAEEISTKMATTLEPR